MTQNGLPVNVSDAVISADGRRWRIVRVQLGPDPHFVAGDDKGTTVLAGYLLELVWSEPQQAWIMDPSQR